MSQPADVAVIAERPQVHFLVAVALRARRRGVDDDLARDLSIIPDSPRRSRHDGQRNQP